MSLNKISLWHPQSPCSLTNSFNSSAFENSITVIGTNRKNISAAYIIFINSVNCLAELMKNNLHFTRSSNDFFLLHHGHTLKQFNSRLPNDILSMGLPNQIILSIEVVKSIHVWVKYYIMLWNIQPI